MIVAFIILRALFVLLIRVDPRSSAANHTFVSFQRAISHVRGTVMLAHAERALTAHLFRSRTVLENLKQGIGQALRIVRLNQQSA